MCGGLEATVPSFWHSWIKTDMSPINSVWNQILSVKMSAVLLRRMKSLNEIFSLYTFGGEQILKY